MYFEHLDITSCEIVHHQLQYNIIYYTISKFAKPSTDFVLYVIRFLCGLLFWPKLIMTSIVFCKIIICQLAVVISNKKYYTTNDAADCNGLTTLLRKTHRSA